MLKNYISDKLLKGLKHKPTSDQAELIKKLSTFITNTIEDEVFVIKGYAGTGKTTLIGTLVQVLKNFSYKTILMAPTGRAAKVLSSYSEKKAYTVHKKIYRQKSSGDGFGVFQLDKNLHTNTIFIVDEASMISNQTQEKSVFGSGNLLDDLFEYVYNGKNCKLILAGDIAQLPPVGLGTSPALSKKELSRYSDHVRGYTLKDVVRQEKASGILSNATMLREIIGFESEETDYPKFSVSDFKDIRKIGGQDLIEELNDSYSRYGMEDTIVVCRSNKRANKYNVGIRNAILFREEEISAGDILMVVKNNYYWLDDNQETDFIANGDILEIKRIHKYEEKYGFRFADVTVQLIDYGYLEIDTKIILDTISVDAPALTQEDNHRLFFTIAEEFADIRSKKKRYEKIKGHPYFNALQVKFSYAITCHKSQGGQWRSVFIDQGYLPDEKIDVEYLRWLYTGLTRATEKLYLVNFKNEFFNEEDINDIDY